LVRDGYETLHVFAAEAFMVASLLGDSFKAIVQYRRSFLSLIIVQCTSSKIVKLYLVAASSA
jgi:hypothetical protein